MYARRLKELRWLARNCGIHHGRKIYLAGVNIGDSRQEALDEGLIKRAGTAEELRRLGVGIPAHLYRPSHVFYSVNESRL